MGKRRNRGNRDEGDFGSEPWHFSHVQQYPIENTFTQIQTTQIDTAPYEFEYIEMYDPSVLQATTSQIMPFIRGLHYGISPYLNANLPQNMTASTAVAAVGGNSQSEQNLTVMAALYDDGGDGSMLEVDQIGIADFTASVHYQYVTATSVDNSYMYHTTRMNCEVTFQKGWLPSPTLTLAFLPTIGFAADGTTFPAGVLAVSGYLEVEWRPVSPSRLRQQALARVFEKGG